MSELDTDAIRERADAATGGPWVSVELGSKGSEYMAVQAPPPFTNQGVPETVAIFYWPCHGEDELSRAEELTVATSEFVAHARTDIPALLAENASLRTRLALAEKVVEAAKNVHAKSEIRNQYKTGGYHFRIGFMTWTAFTAALAALTTPAPSAPSPVDGLREAALELQSLVQRLVDKHPSEWAEYFDKAITSVDVALAALSDKRDGFSDGDADVCEDCGGDGATCNRCRPPVKRRGI